jgi:hypothetical protein
MVEATVLAPILILLWMGVDYFRAAYTRRMQALSMASHDAWKRSEAADGSCFTAAQEPKPRVFVDMLESLAAGGPFASMVRGAVERYVDTRPAWAFRRGHVEIEVSVATRRARWGGGPSAVVTGGMYLPCNEVVPSDDRDVHSALDDYLYRQIAQ